MDNQENKTFLDKLKALDHNQKMIICTGAAIILMVCMIVALVSCRNQDMPEETTPSTSVTEESTEAETKDPTETSVEEATEAPEEESTEAQAEESEGVTAEAPAEEGTEAAAKAPDNSNKPASGTSSTASKKPSSSSGQSNSQTSKPQTKPTNPKPNKPQPTNPPAPKPTNPPAPKPTNPPTPKPTNPPAPKPTDPPATEPPAPTECPHDWQTINHPEEGHYVGGCQCACGAVFSTTKEWITHSQSFEGSERQNHMSNHSYDEWIVDKPAWSETVCRLCGAKK